MKTLTMCASAGAVIALIFSTQTIMCTSHAEKPHFVGNSTGFAVVELFTSEGCSSCPPADELVARLQREDAREPVYILAFHVDYWDRLGWKDAFSDAQYTRRQNQYASWLKLSSIYTPQVVVNGRQEMVGSQESALRKAIEVGLAETPAVSLSLRAIGPDQGKIAWHCAVGHGGKDRILLVALVQKSATTAVKAGENSGRTLSHVQIVRGLTSRDIGSGGAADGDLALPGGMRAADGEMIAFVQDSGNGQILAAASAAIP